MRSRLTYANMMATVAVFIALGGASYAALKVPKNSVGAKQLKKNAVTTAKVKNGAVTGEKIAVSTLPTVPSATRADHAVSAETATGAGTAINANHADNLAPPEPVHYIGAPGEPKFFGSYIGATVGFYRDRQCVVHLLGQVSGPTNGTAFVLPMSDAPKYPVFEALALSGGVLANIEIDEDGGVKPYTPGSGTANFGLDGVTFRAANC
jgi:hypothetical protein